MHRLPAVVRDSNDAVILHDFEGKILAWNRGASETYGYTESESLGKNVQNLVAEPDRDAALALIQRIRRGEVVKSFELRRVAKDGRILNVWLTTTLLVDDRGQPVAIATTERDITDRLKNERLALRSQRLEALGTLAGGVAHDLNNALAPIMMGVEMLKIEFPNASRIVDMFQSSAQRAADMVRQLLTFAKGAEGERVSVRLPHLAKEMQALMKGSFPKNIQVVIKCASNIPTILGDGTQLFQVLLNLCVNARDAMPQGGTLTIEALRLEMDATYSLSVPDAKPGVYGVLRVRDTGSGIPPDILDRIFEPFFTTKGPDKGTGLGLSTTLGIVKGHGGFLQVYSRLGEGSTFVVHLPAESMGYGAGLPAEGAIEFRGSEETILLVDDDIGVRDMGRAVLRQMNFTPLTATDGVDGLIQASEHRTRLRAIVTDLHMPHMDGLTFIRGLRRILPDISRMGSGVRWDRLKWRRERDWMVLADQSLRDRPSGVLLAAGAARSNRFESLLPRWDWVWDGVD